jgi:hypothetical protein
MDTQDEILSQLADAAAAVEQQAEQLITDVAVLQSRCRRVAKVKASLQIAVANTSSQLVSTKLSIKRLEEVVEKPNSCSHLTSTPRRELNDNGNGDAEVEFEKLTTKLAAALDGQPCRVLRAKVGVVLLEHSPFYFSCFCEDSGRMAVFFGAKLSGVPMIRQPCMPPLCVHYFVADS